MSASKLLADASRSLLHALSPTAFASSLGVTLDPWQSALAEHMLSGPGRRAIALNSRQSGKSLCASIIACARAVFYPGSTVLLVAPTLRQSTLLFTTTAGLIRRVPGVKLTQDTITASKLSNGSYVVSLPGTDGSAVRGYTADLCCVDEASFVAETSGMWEALLPMLAVSGGSLLLTSTPNGKQGFFYETFMEGDDSWHKVRVPWQQCSRIKPEFIEEQRRTHGPRYVAVEFECQFADQAGQYFDDEAVMAILDPTLPRLEISF